MSNVKNIIDFTGLISRLQASESCHKPEQIEEHPAWHGHVDLNMASALLERKSPFSYIFSSLTTANTYILSYVRQDHIVAHTIFKKADSDDGWEYRNGDIHLCKTLDELACEIMHCKREEGRFLSPMPIADIIKA